MAKKLKTAKNRHIPLLIILAAAVLVSLAILGWAAYHAAPHNKTVIPKLNSKIPYVDGPSATDQVANFYQQYIDQRLTAKFPDYHKTLIEGYGSRNLVFYNQYYRHGFDPIICSNVMPTKVTANLVSTGPVATVKASLEYPDKTNTTVTARVVLDDEGLQIDSLTCPGAKGNLPPASAP